MNQPFDSDAIAKLGWRQGAILDAELAESACKHAPATVTMGDGDWLCGIRPAQAIICQSKSSRCLGLAQQ